jgi:hypothetical protein
MLLYQLHRPSSRKLGAESWYLGRMLKEMDTALPWQSAKDTKEPGSSQSWADVIAGRPQLKSV